MAGTAAEGFEVLTGNETKTWEAGWHNVLPFIGRHPPGASLSVLLWANVLLQLIYLSVLLIVERCCFRSRVILGRIEFLGYAAQILSLGSVATLMTEMRSKLEQQTGKHPLPKHGLFWMKVMLQQLAQTWLSISLLGIAWPTTPTASKIVMLASVLISTMTSIKNSIDHKSISMALESSQISEVGRFLNILFAAIALVVNAMNVVRLVGVFVCSSGLLNLTSGCVCLSNTHSGV